MGDTAKVAMVTGAGSGIGRAIALALAGQRMTVYVIDVDEAAARATAQSITNSGGVARSSVVDVRDNAEVTRVVDECVGAFGHLDVAVNNAGIMDRFMPVHECNDEIWTSVLDVNLTGAFRVARSVLPHMLERRSGLIVNIASVAGLAGGRGGAAYTASKHALIGLTKSIAWMYVDDGIRSNAVCPGGVGTGIGARSGEPSELGHARVQATLATCPRYGEPEEIADVVGFLASPKARFLNGVAIPVDGGWAAA